MYLADFQLRELCEQHALVEPFDPARINPASIDLTLGREFVNLSSGAVEFRIGEFGAVAGPGDRFNADVVRLEPGVALLATTAERVKIPDRYSRLGSVIQNTSFSIEACVAELRLKSSAARNGLDHALAGWIDPGFDGTLTLELHAHRPIELFVGKAYVQMIVAAMLAAPTKSYQQTGRYIGAAAQGAVCAKE